MKTIKVFTIMVDILPPMKRNLFGEKQNDSCATTLASSSSSTTTSCHSSNSSNHSNSSSSASSSSTCSVASSTSDAGESDHGPAPSGATANCRKRSSHRPSHHVATAPPGVNFDENPTVFGEILRGESPATVLSETEQTLAFLDIHPNAPFHGLVIPKRHVPTILNLQPSDQDLLEEMRNTAHALLQEHRPMAWKTGDYILCFHVPPYNSVDHLHLHVLAPKSKMRWRPRVFQYNTSVVNRAVSLDAVQKRLSSSYLTTTKQQGRGKQSGNAVVATNSRFYMFGRDPQESEQQQQRHLV
ncbi:hypothetical protein ACA910_006314 [Epithemia clementina (nom. ined.)]